MQYATLFPEIKILTLMMTQLSWSHFIAIIPLKREGIYFI
jgi:hypothetical protein